MKHHPPLRLLAAALAATTIVACHRDDPAPALAPQSAAPSTAEGTAAKAAPAATPSAPAVDAATQRKAKLLAEVVLRLRADDAAAPIDDTTKVMLDKALRANADTPEFVELVEAFALKDRDADLLRIAAAHPTESHGALAIRLVLDHGGSAAIAPALAGNDALAIARALGSASDKRALFLLQPIVLDAARPLALRQEAVHSLGQFESGARALLAMVKRQSLPAELQTATAGVLALAPWDAVRAEVQATLPPPQTVDAPLPPLAELVQRTGDAAHGAQVFATVCTTCHRIAGTGTDYGPDLSQIGSKLGKDGLYLAILFPDAGIEFNFATTVLGLADGNSAVGIVVSDTDDMVAIKSIGGTVTRYRTKDIRTRQQQKTSSMPSGLQASMRQQDLIDLVEYLASLQKQ